MNGYYEGLVSSIDAESGRVRVTYPEEDNAISEWLPLLAFEYNLPEVGALVATVINEYGNGVCLGKIYSNGQPPGTDTGYKKNIDGVEITKQGNVFEVRFDSNTYIRYSGGKLHIHAADVQIDGYTPPTTEG